MRPLLYLAAAVAAIFVLALIPAPLAVTGPLAAVLLALLLLADHPAWIVTVIKAVLRTD